MIPFIFIPSNLARVLSQIREPRVHVKAPVCFLVAECFSSWRRLVGQQSDFAAGDEGSDRLSYRFMQQPHRPPILTQPLPIKNKYSSFAGNTEYATSNTFHFYNYAK
jgi:hypothetical protein